MAEADETQIKILNENRQRLEDSQLRIGDLVGKTHEALVLLELLHSAAYSVTESFEDTPYLAGAIVILLSDMAEQIRDGKSISYPVVNEICNELLDYSYRTSLSKSPHKGS